MPSAFLEDRGVVRVAGADARPFAQGLFTCDMEKVAPGKAAFGALLTPQGKIVVDFIASMEDDVFLFDCPRALAADFAKRLRFYKLRAHVDVADLSNERGVVAAWGADAEGSPDPRAEALGARRVVARPAAADPVARAAYDARRMALGVPAGGIDFAYGDAFPHEANMDLLNGVDFKKGCYVGQEVVSRVEHRGSARKRIARVSFPGEAAPGSVLTAGDVEIGVLGSSAPGVGLAMVRVDRFAEAMAAGTPIMVDGREAALALPGKPG
jgi:folate-binding protein YgfZ